MDATAFHSVIMVFREETAFRLWSAIDLDVIICILCLIYFIPPVSTIGLSLPYFDSGSAVNSMLRPLFLAAGYSCNIHPLLADRTATLYYRLLASLCRLSVCL